MHREPSLTLTDISVIRDGQKLLGPIDWSVDGDERWVVLGPNGSGKSNVVDAIK